MGGTKNPHRSEVAHDISGAILKTSAKNNVPAVYWSQEEQEIRLEQAFKKWADRGDVWTAAAQKVYYPSCTSKYYSTTHIYHLTVTDSH